MIVPEHLQTLEASLPPILRRAANDDSGNNPSWVFEGKQPSLADVAVYALVGKAVRPSTGSIVTGLDDLDPTPALTDCPRLSAAVRAMDVLPDVQSWHARRPDILPRGEKGFGAWGNLGCFLTLSMSFVSSCVEKSRFVWTML